MVNGISGNRKKKVEDSVTKEKPSSQPADYSQQNKEHEELDRDLKDKAIAEDILSKDLEESRVIFNGLDDDSKKRVKKYLDPQTIKSLSQPAPQEQPMHEQFRREPGQESV